MGFPEITQALNRETEAWNAHDADGVAACYAENAVLYDVGLPDTVQGRAAIRDAAEQPLSPHLRRVRGGGHHRGTGSF